MGQALTTEAIAECIRSGGVWEAESNIEWLDLVSTPAAANWDAAFTVERINLQQNIAKAFRRKCEFDHMRKVPFVPKADDLALAMSHPAQSSSASRVTAGASGFFILSHFCYDVLVMTLHARGRSLDRRRPATNGWAFRKPRKSLPFA